MNSTRDDARSGIARLMDGVTIQRTPEEQHATWLRAVADTATSIVLDRNYDDALAEGLSPAEANARTYVVTITSLVSSSDYWRPWKDKNEST